MQKIKPKGQAPAALPTAGAYFSVMPELERFSSGCAVLDGVLGGGWALGRMSNIIGDKSTAKTGLTIEACANFAQAYPKGKVFYREAEHAFDVPYAQFMGFPQHAVMWEEDHKEPLETVEDIFEDLTEILAKTKNEPVFYAVDSLDALSDREELKRNIDDATYAMNKQKRLGQMFRRLVGPLEASRVCLVIVSQVRHNIGVTFGEKYTRTGGKSMDFFASHCLWLSHIETLTQERGGYKRATGIRVKALCKKNKVGLPFRDCTFPYLFGYGMDDITASADFLEETGELAKVIGATTKAKYIALIKALPDPAARTQARHDLAEVVREVWARVDTQFLPKYSKY